MKYKIKKIRKERGLTQAAVVEAASISQPYLSQLENSSGGRAPSMDTLIAIAEVLNVRPSELFDDAKPVAIAGKVGAGARVPLVDAYEKGDGLYLVACPSELPHDISIVGVEVEGDSMTPVYRDGDVLFYSRDVIGVPTEAVGAICVCEDENGNGWVKHVKPGSEPGKFHLISLNPLVDNMFDITLKWATPVRLAWPRALVERL
ncbi:MAG: helix-turn-helix domain-containing protein [Alphaproteobacteria bacterium]|nr:helix-turn-helix domain-containing protein [Alphaproteobacteria bacterium]